ncbi:nitrate/nitrite two-component system sensor histidine kinase NarQ [Serratia microhaemolytica]|uniref:nitrate/nitrite two-component system sensor histidine kinase NarQ n=1 Tax=Serratia microhaemolytica TaxID=2675110 RepID=UPI000FDF215B|nr:nitrate/nitrite two-component system sensor histidine kinase NarQ [Serratia microhaemolytica]
MLVKRSVTSSLAKALTGIVILSVLSTGLALTTVAGSLRDAEAVNIAGSLRMQSYRLAYELANPSHQLNRYLTQYQNTLEAPSLHKLDHAYVPEDVRQQYITLRHSWQTLEQQILAGQTEHYQHNVASHVAQIDQFVLALQRYSERKLTVVAVISVMGYIAIIGLVLFCIRFMRRQVVAPLKQLVHASRYMQQRDFNHPPLDVSSPNELGVLSQTFTAMSSELAKLYQSLEQKVQEKTERLQQANRTLEVLYRCSQALGTGKLDQQAFEKVLRIVRSSEQLQCIRLNVQDSLSEWQIGSGEPLPDLPWHSQTIMQESKPRGSLSWQHQGQAPHPHLMQSVSNMLSRGMHFNRAQKQHMQFLLMEERATIARELHDSLAQALTFLRIQLTLLKRTLAGNPEQANEIINNFDQALAEAYRQLRHLLSTFRLTVQDADLNIALQQVLEPLRLLTQAEIQLDCRIASQALNAQQQVHALQIVREAVLNAIKHADAKKIVIHCEVLETGDNCITITDDGSGIESLDEPEGHYGLTIMSERAARLGGKLQIQRISQHGTQVCLRFPC